MDYYHFFLFFLAFPVDPAIIILTLFRPRWTCRRWQRRRRWWSNFFTFLWIHHSSLSTPMAIFRSGT